MRYARLLCISDANHNKYYDMRECPDGTFEARYGRVGAAAQVRTYPMRSWEAKRGEKLRKGYRDERSPKLILLLALDLPYSQAQEGR